MGRGNWKLKYRSNNGLDLRDKPPTYLKVPNRRPWQIAKTVQALKCMDTER